MKRLMAVCCFVALTGIALQLFLSLLVDAFNRSRNYEHTSNDFSFVIIQPVTWLFSALWGLFLDKQRHRAEA